MEKGLSFLRKHALLKPLCTKKHIVNLSPLQPNRDIFYDLVKSIVSQQLSVKAASTIFGRFEVSFREKKFTPRKILNKDIEAMRAVGLSYSKANYIKNVAEFFRKRPSDVAYWNSFSSDEIIAELTSIKGIGVWTTQMILIFTLHKKDVFPTGDVGIQNAMKKYCGLKGQGKIMLKNMGKIAEAWSPHRSLACRVLWSALDNDPSK